MGAEAHETFSRWLPVFVAMAAEESPFQPYALPAAVALFAAGFWLRTGRAPDVSKPAPALQDKRCGFSCGLRRHAA